MRREKKDSGLLSNPHLNYSEGLCSILAIVLTPESGDWEVWDVNGFGDADPKQQKNGPEVRRLEATVWGDWKEASPASVYQQQRRAADVDGAEQLMGP